MEKLRFSELHIKSECKEFLLKYSICSNLHAQAKGKQLKENNGPLLPQFGEHHRPATCTEAGYRVNSYLRQNNLLQYELWDYNIYVHNINVVDHQKQIFFNVNGDVPKWASMEFTTSHYQNNTDCLGTNNIKNIKK